MSAPEMGALGASGAAAALICLENKPFRLVDSA